MSKLKVLGALLMAMAWLVPGNLEAAQGINGSPGIINFYLDWQLKEEDLPILARWDIVVLDGNQQARYPDRIRKLRRLNPAIKILAYIPSEEFATVHLNEPSDYPYNKLGRQIRSDWWLRDPQGNLIYFWPGQPMLDVTNKNPALRSGERWNDFLPRFIRDNLMSSGLWDGIFLDNTFDGLKWFVKSPVDLDRDGKADNQDDIDKAWREGMKFLLARIHELNPNAILIGNGGAVYADQLNGVLFEHFPSWSWGPNWKEVRDTVAKNRAPVMTAINVNTDNKDRPNDYRLMRFGLGSALTSGSYYSFDRGSSSHNSVWWYDEYEAALGSPTAAPKILAGAVGQGTVPAVWGRKFQNGLALVNSTDAVQSIDLPGVYEKIRGRQDPNVNDGSLVRSVTLQPRDGLILFKRSEAREIRDAAYTNGAFVRLYDASGRQKYNGFFAQRIDAPSGASVWVGDLDNDESDELVIADKGTVKIVWGRKKADTRFQPFGKTYSGKIWLAVGQANRDGAQELILAREGAQSVIKVFSASGKELARWTAYNPAFLGGVRLAIGDLDGDGLREIVSAAGPGGGPHLKIWKTDGKVWGGGWFAFDQSESGGVSVAVGDVDGDGRDEIIVGSGRGAVPRVRVFDGRGNLKSSFSLGDRPLSGGLEVSASDVDNDGRAEIVVGGLPAI
jgi:hypothetical protein